MFVRRYYYDILSGETVLSYMMQGNVLQGSVEKDFITYEQLLERSIDDTGFFEWLEPDEAIELQFEEHNELRVENGKLVFFDVSIPDFTEPTYQELLEAYNILTGGNNNE